MARRASTSRSTARWSSRIVMFGSRARRRRCSARLISRPVASRGWRMRRCEWPPSRPRSNSRSSGSPPHVEVGARARSGRGPGPGPRGRPARRRRGGTGRRRRRACPRRALEGVVGAPDRGDAALGVAGSSSRAARSLVTSDDAAARGALEREGEPGDAAADDEEVALDAHEGAQLPARGPVRVKRAVTASIDLRCRVSHMRAPADAGAVAAAG